MLRRRDMMIGMAGALSFGRSAFGEAVTGLYVPPEEGPHERTFM
ncbi:MAG: hypothetical protein ACRBBO_06005 [Cognatishimia sp.]